MDTKEWATVVVVLVWLVPFVAGGRLAWGAPTMRGHTWLSAAAGISVAYVFMELFPQMSRMQHTFTTAVEGRRLPAPEFRVYFVALVGFLVFYSIQNLMTVPGEQLEGRDRILRHRVDFAGFTGYCGLMGYLLVEEAHSLISLALYGLAILFHFGLVDNSLRHAHGELYHRSGRWIIIAGLLAGWAVGMSTLNSHAIVPTLFGFIGGGVVINSLRGEIPEAGEGRTIPMVMGAITYAILLAVVEAHRK